MKNLILLILLQLVSCDSHPKSETNDITVSHILIISVMSCEKPENVRLMVGMGNEYVELDKTGADKALSQYASIKRIHFQYQDKLIPAWFDNSWIRSVLPDSVITVDPALGSLPTSEIIINRKAPAPYEHDKDEVDPFN
jgi:hypothetical protein